MAMLTVRMNAESLKRQTVFELFLPNDPVSGKMPPDSPMNTLFLLHGYRSGPEFWLPEELARKYRLAVVMPNGENSFWLDGISTGHAFGTLIGEELPAYLQKTFGLAQSREHTFLMGVSMGGFGALRTALARPGRFGKAAAFSAALIQHEVAEMQPGKGNFVANFEYYRECFGEPAAVLQSDKNPEYLAERLLNAGEPLPELYLCCGTEDFLLEPNRAFHQFLTAHGIAHTYREDKGGHDMQFWRRFAPEALAWLAGENEE